jgi:hypothetical protein
MSDEMKPYDENAAQARRLAILSELAQSRIGDSLKTPAVSAPTPMSNAPETKAAAPVAPWRASKNRLKDGHRRLWWILPITLVLLLALGFGGVYLLSGVAQSQQPQKVAAPQDIVLEANGLSCPRGAAWSPDGRDIAVVGYKETCPSNFPGFYRYHPGVLQVYDATTGALLSDFKLDDAIQPKLALPPSSTPQGQEVIFYDAISWAPDGRRVAVTFGAFHWVQNPCFNPGPTVTGVIISDAFASASANGGGATPSQRVLVRAPRTNDFSAPMWDLQEARALNAPIVPALGYQWNPNGYLKPDTPLSVGGKPAAPAMGPIGAPNGSAPFTIWQSGEIERHGYYTVTLANCEQRLTTTAAPPYTFRSNFSVWSPDGRYFAPDGGFEGLAQPASAPPPDPQALSDQRLTQAVAVPIRDAALERALSSLRNAVGGAGSSDTSFAQVSWRPDGKTLVVYHAYTSGQLTGYDRILTLYDCATGRPLGDLTPPKHTGPSQDDYPSSRLYWAPDGARLLLMDAQTSALRIWGASLLPK